MATQVLADILTSLSQVFAPALDRQFNHLSVLAELLPKQNGAGKNVAWDVRFSRTTHAANFTEGADVAAGEFNVDVTQPASLSWAAYRAAFALSGLSVAAAAGSVGSALELLDQFGSNLVDAGSDLVSQINAGLYSAAGTGSLLAGLSGAGAIAATGTYANINRSTYAEWAANVLSNGGVGRALTKALMDQMEENIYSACGMMPDIIVTTPALARTYESLFDTIQRVIVERGDITSINPNVTNVGGGMIPANTGYTGLSYKGIPIYRDRNCPTGKMFFLNRQYVAIRVLPQVNMGNSVMQQNTMLAGAPGNDTRIQARIDSLAKNGDADKFQLVAYLQLAVRKPNACGLIDDLT
jgi:hypothetical protein